MSIAKCATFACFKVLCFVSNLVLDRLIALILFFVLSITETTSHETLTGYIMLIKPLNAIMIAISTIFTNCMTICIMTSPPLLFVINYVGKLPIWVRFWETFCLSLLLLRTYKLDSRGFCNSTTTFLIIPCRCSLARCFWCTSLAREIHHTPQNLPLSKAEMSVHAICITWASLFLCFYAI